MLRSESLHHRLIPLLFIALVVLTACQIRATPPGPDTHLGVVDETGYTLFHWDEGLRIFIWDDLREGGWVSSGGSTEDAVYRLEGLAEAPDGRSYRYILGTEDGQTASLTIADETFDVQQGRLFIVRTKRGAIEVEQLQRDLSTIPLSHDGIGAFGRADSAVAAFIAANATAETE